jgi:hypothetical protein
MGFDKKKRKQRSKKNRQTKTLLVFDEKARKYVIYESDISFLPYLFSTTAQHVSFKIIIFG